MVEGEEEKTTATPPNGLRCKRADGRGWRCKKPRVDGGGGFCEAHYLQKLARARPRVSVEGNGQEGSRRRGRPRKVVVSVAEGDGEGEKEENLKAGAEDLKGKDLGKVYERRRKRAEGEDSKAGKGVEVYDYERRKGATLEDLTAGRGDLEARSPSLARDLNDSEKDAAGNGGTTEGVGAQSSMPCDLPLHQCSTVTRTAAYSKTSKDYSPSKRGHMVADEINKEGTTFLAKGDEEVEKEKTITAGESLKTKDVEKVFGRRKRAKKGDMKVGKDLGVGLSSVDRVLDGFENVPDHMEKPKENPIARRGQQELYPQRASRQNLYQGNIVERRSDFTSIHNTNMVARDDENELKDDTILAPLSSPSSPNIGESTHQHSLLDQTQPESCNEPPALSGSTSFMARKRQEGGQNKIVDAMLETLETGSGKKVQKAKQALSIDEFSISKCAAVLNEMTCFTPEELVKASRVFVKSFNREMFLSLKDELRRVWLRAQISD